MNIPRRRKIGHWIGPAWLCLGFDEALETIANDPPSLPGAIIVAAMGVVVLAWPRKEKAA